MSDITKAILENLKIKEQTLTDTIERDKARLEMLKDTIWSIEKMVEKKGSDEE